LGFVLSSPILHCFWCAVTEFVTLNHSHANFCSTDGDFSVFMWSKFHRQWQQCPTPELVNTTSSKVNKQLEEARFYRLTSFNQIQTKIDVFYFDENIFWHKPILPAKTIFASPVFTVVHKPRSKDIITYRL